MKDGNSKEQTRSRINSAAHYVQGQVVAAGHVIADDVMSSFLLLQVWKHHCQDEATQPKHTTRKVLGKKSTRTPCIF